MHLRFDELLLGQGTSLAAAGPGAWREVCDGAFVHRVDKLERICPDIFECYLVDTYGILRGEC